METIFITYTKAFLLTLGVVGMAVGTFLFLFLFVTGRIKPDQKVTKVILLSGMTFTCGALSLSAWAGISVGQLLFGH